MPPLRPSVHRDKNKTIKTKGRELASAHERSWPPPPIKALARATCSAKRGRETGDSEHNKTMANKDGGRKVIFNGTERGNRNGIELMEGGNQFVSFRFVTVP
jgi:hypothetical protein